MSRRNPEAQWTEAQWTGTAGLLFTLLIWSPALAQTTKPPEKIDVQVVDHRGRPIAGVLMRAAWHLGGAANPGEPTTRTDKSGRAQIQPPKTLMRGAKLFVEPFIPMQPPVRVEIALGTFVNDPNKPVRVEIPPYGTVRIKVVDVHGKTVDGVEDVYMRHYHGPRARYYGAPSINAFTASRYGTWDGHFATFPFVAVGQQTEIWCKLDGRHLAPQLIGGPGHPLDLRVEALKGVSSPPGFVFTLSGLDGKPVEDEQIGLIYTGGRRVRVETAATGRGGRVRVTIPTDFCEQDESQVVLVRRGKSPTDHLGALRLSIPQSIEHKDLGALRLVTEPLLVAGRIVDDADQPVSGAVVSVEPHYLIGGNSTVVFAGSKFLEHKLVTGADGRFEFRELGEDRARVDLKIERGFTQAIDGYATLRGGSVAAGTNNHTVVVVRTTFISGSIAGVAAGTRAVYGIEVLDQAGQWLRGISVLWEKGGAFTIRNCPPGKYDVGFSPRPGLAAIRKVEGVVVEAGKSCADPRLRGVDLSR